MKSGPPGWERHKVTTRLDGWVLDPNNEDRIPAGVAEMIARAMPQPTEVEIIRARMKARQEAYDRSHKESIYE
jgi:hypothetical protein